MARPKAFDEEKALEQAMHLFWQKGYAATSIQDLVDHLGIGRRSLYNTFESKRSLFLRSLAYYQENYSSRPPQTAEGVTSMKRAIGNILNFYVEDGVTRHDRVGCFVVNSAVELGPHDDVVRDQTMMTISRLEALFYNILVQGDPDELNTTLDLRMIAQNLMNTVLGLRVLSKVHPDRQTLENIVQSAMSIFR